MAEQGQKIVIPCTLTITPGGTGMQNRIRLEANGETVCDDYERDLDPGVVAVAKQIAVAHSRLLNKWGQP